MKRSILLGLTGSVASTLYVKLIEQLSEHFIVDVILTEKSKHFVNIDTILGLLKKHGGSLHDEESEWTWKDSECLLHRNRWQKNDPVLHINLRDQASALVIAPCSANTLAKISGGICDNLLTSIARAWDRNRPFIIAPAMNTYMLEHPTTGEHLLRFTKFSKNNYNIPVQSKMLACGTYGAGAMGSIEDIIKETIGALKWSFPLSECNGLPIEGHPGAFACQRKHEKHTGVDLYSKEGSLVKAVEAGVVVGVEHFTGEWDNSPWWENTNCVLIEGASGVVCYGEIDHASWISVGKQVQRGQYIGNVKRVLKDGKERKDIPGHSTSMLHIELYPHGTVKASNGFENHLQDPTPFLLETEAYGKILKYESVKEA